MLRQCSSIVSRTIIRNFQKKDFPEVVSILKEDEQPIDIAELPFMLEVDPSFLLVAEKDGKEVAGFVSVINYGKFFSALGFFTVKKEYKGLGIAKLLKRDIVKRFGDRNPIRYELFRDRSYHSHGPFKSSVECEYLEAAGRTDGRDIILTKESQKSEDLPSIVEPSSIDFNKILAYDTSLHVEPREKYLRTMFKWSAFKTRLALDSSGNIAGYGTLRKINDREYYMAPLYADNALTAKLIYKKLLGFCGAGKNITAVVPSSNVKAVKLLDELGLNIIWRGYRHSAYRSGISLDRVYFPASLDCTLV